jgi:uncharacterized membrane protein YebE (DUF533 family)
VEAQHEAMLKSLVAIAWADGHFGDDEAEIIEALISTFKIDRDGADLVRAFAKTPRTLEDVPVADLSVEDRRTLLTHAVILTHIDGGQDEAERSMLVALVPMLGIDDAEAKTLIADGEKQAKLLLDLD